jgi:hypothetical protein
MAASAGEDMALAMVRQDHPDCASMVGDYLAELTHLVVRRGH